MDIVGHSHIQNRFSLLSDDDVHWLNEGTHFRLYRKLGAQLITTSEGTPGTYFAVFAPNAQSASVIGSFNEWEGEAHKLHPRANSGVWEGFAPNVSQGTTYKFRIRGKDGRTVDKADPYGYRHEEPPSNTSIVWSLDYEWHDETWMHNRHGHGSIDRPISIYEVHLGSWLRPQDGRRYLRYDEIADPLIDHVVKSGFTHVELLPVTEHPFYGSWGYQTTGYFAPTNRYGTPQQLMQLIDRLHQRSIGVIVDWVPGHFPNDEHGLGYFDGTHLYEHPDPRRGVHPEWDSYIFDYARREVQSFLFSSAFYWADKYHVDGFRVDAVSSLLYLNYGRKDGEWIPNEFGGRENLDAVAFLKRFNDELAARYPDVKTFAEEATSWPQVTGPTDRGGLGFDYKWDMGWMNDTLSYFKEDPGHREFHSKRITFRPMYAHSEKYVLPLSHDEVVHGKGSLLSRMPGEYADKFANLRLLLANQFMQPGKKLLFMGGEFGQWTEWAHDGSIAWDRLKEPLHRGVCRWVQNLNDVYRSEPALHELDTDAKGFEWVDCLDTNKCVASFLRRGRSEHAMILALFNYSAFQCERYRVGVPLDGFWQEILNSDAGVYGGSGSGNLGGAWASTSKAHGHAWSLELTLPPLSCVVMKPYRDDRG